MTGVIDALARYYSTSRNPKLLPGVGIICTGYGIYLIKRAWEGDTLLPGTLTVYVPKWIFVVTGLLLQAPLPLAWFFLKNQGII